MGALPTLVLVLDQCYRSPMTTRSKTTASLLALLILLAPISSCNDDPEPEAHPWGEMYGEVEDWLWTVHEDDVEMGDYHEGDWDPDWDDAPFYGLAYYANVGFDQGNVEYQARAREAAEHNLGDAQAGLDDLTGEFMNNISAILYGSLGMIDYIAASGDDSRLETVDEVISMANSTMMLMGNYVNGFENYATETYGPTSITAIFALINLQRAVLLETENEEVYVETARQILETIESQVWNGRLYQFSPDNEEDLYLYPNVAMMIALTRAYQATGEESYLERAEVVHSTLRAEMRYDDRPGYYSPYSAEYMGAETRDYTTLSSTNYMLLALALLYEATGEQAYRAEIDVLLDFVEDYLWVRGDGRIYHHWIDGHLAEPTDHEYYCIGCNLQLLYIIWWIQTNLDEAG